MKYRPEIDGLRALAVVPVMFFHAGSEIFSGGFVGVDVFFVISGYLITTILIEDIESKRFSIVNFYERRARRILPALFFVMLACLPFAWLWMLPSQLKDFSQSLVAVSLFASNALFWLESGYFDAAAEEKPLLHTWSLAVEEQYYLGFPIFLILAWRFGKDRVFWMIVVMAAISLFLSEWGSRNLAMANFYLAPTRVWEIFMGSIAAFIVHKHGVRKSETLAVLGLAAILVAIVLYDETTPFPSVYALAPVLGAVLLILYADKGTRVARLLSARSLVGIGLISYSTYLWHQPLFAFARIRHPEILSGMLIWAVILASLGFGYFSWRYIETIFRKKNHFSRKFVFLFALGGMLLFSIIGFQGHIAQGFPGRYQVRLKGDVGHLQYHRYIDEKYVDCEPATVASSAPSWEGFLRCKQSTKGAPDLILLGDSHAEHLFIGLADANPDKNVAFYIKGTPPYYDRKEYRGIFDAIAELSSPAKVLLTMNFSKRVTSHLELEEGFAATIRFLMNLGHQVVVVGDIPIFSESPEACKMAGYEKRDGSDCVRSTMLLSTFQAQTDIYEETLEKLASEFSIPFIQIYEPLCDSIRCSMISNQTILYRDNDHLNIPGSMMIGKYLSGQLKEHLPLY